MSLKDLLTSAGKSEFVKVDDKNRFYYMLQQMQNIVGNVIVVYKILIIIVCG
jgi:hypothetical protein